MPELTNEELLKTLNEAKSTGIFKNSESDLVDISDFQFRLISKELEEVKLTTISLLIGGISEASLKSLNEIFQAHPEIEKIELECYSATPQQMAKIAAILPANSHEVDLVFSKLNEDILLKMLLPIGKLVKITNLFMASYADQFGSQILEFEAKILKFLYACKNLEEFIIDNRSEDGQHAKKLKDFSDQINAFLQYRKNLVAFRANSEQQVNFDSVIAFFDIQLSLVAKLATGTFHFVQDDYFDFLIKYLSHSHYSYKQIPQVINCFVPFFQGILEHNLYHYLKFCLSFSDCVRQASVEDNIEEKDKKKILYEKEIFAATFLLEYELRTQLAKEENLVITVDAQYQAILVNLLNDLINQGLVNQTLKDFFTQHREEFCDILADVAKCMNKYKLPTDETFYRVINESDCQSLMSGLLSKNGRKQLIERKYDKITQYLQTTNSILSTQNDILQTKNELLTNRIFDLEGQLLKLQNNQLSKKHRNTASPQFFSQESPDLHEQKFTSLP